MTVQSVIDKTLDKIGMYALILLIAYVILDFVFDWCRAALGI